MKIAPPESISRSTCCTLCGRRELLTVETCPVTGEPVTICADPLGCLEREKGPEGRAFKAARFVALSRPEGRG